MLPDGDLHLHQSRSARLFFIINYMNRDSSALDYPIIVHCHLRWEGVWQRPQQFLSRLSKNHRVLFVESPLLHDRNERPTFTIAPVAQYPAITVMQTHFPSSRFQDGGWV